MLIQNSRQYFELSRAYQSATPIDVHKEMRRSGGIQRVGRDLIVANTTLQGIGKESQGNRLETETYLPFAAKHYHISPDINDYVIVPVVTIPADLPNRNEVAFPLKELVRFQPEYGVPSFMTFRGKPVHYEHDNKDITKAYGIILDAYLRKFELPNTSTKIWKMVELLAIDRSKHPDVAAAILNRTLNSYSMGSYVGHYECSYCGGIVGKTCNHLKLKNVRGDDNFYEKDGKLVALNCCDIVGFETSIVGDPAYLTAISDTVMTY